MLTAEAVQASNPGSKIFTAGALSVVVRRPPSQEWDLYVDMRKKKPADARQMLRGCILFPSREELSRQIERLPALAGKLEELVWELVSPDSGKMVASDKHSGAQMLTCDGVVYHLRQPECADYDAFEEGRLSGYSAAATHLVKACLLEPSALEFDKHNAQKPGLKHVLCGSLARLAGSEVEFVEKK